MGNLPKLPEGAPGRNGFRYREQFGVIIVCKDEARQKAVYEQLLGLGFNCKVVRT